MPGRKTIDRSGPGNGTGVSVGEKFAYDPCNNPRNPLDWAGRVNDLINCYWIHIRSALVAQTPMIVLAIILLIILVIAARELLK